MFTLCDISPYGDAIYLLRKCDIRFPPFACDMICILFHVPQAHIAPKVYRFPEGYIAHFGRNAYRCRDISATNCNLFPASLLRRAVVRRAGIFHVLGRGIHFGHAQVALVQPHVFAGRIELHHVAAAGKHRVIGTAHVFAVGLRFNVEGQLQRVSGGRIGNQNAVFDGRVDPIAVFQYIRNAHPRIQAETRPAAVFQRKRNAPLVRNLGSQPIAGGIFIQRDVHGEHAVFGGHGVVPHGFQRNGGGAHAASGDGAEAGERNGIRLAAAGEAAAHALVDIAVGDAVAVRQGVVAGDVTGVAHLIFHQLVAGETVHHVPVFGITALYQLMRAHDHILDAAGLAVLFLNGVPLGVFRQPAERGGKRKSVIVDALALLDIVFVVRETAELDDAGGEPHGGMHVAEKLHAVVEIARYAQQVVCEALRQVQRHLVALQLPAAHQRQQRNGVADRLFAAPGVAGEIEAAVFQVHVVREFVHRHGLFTVAAPERAHLALDHKRPHAPHQLGGAHLGKLVVRVFLGDQVHRGQNVAHLVKGCVHRVGPRVGLAEAQPVLAPALHQVPPKALLYLVPFFRAEDIHAAAKPLIPRANQLGVVHTAVGGLGGLLVGQKQPVRQVVVSGVHHVGDVMVYQPRAFGQIEFLVHKRYSSSMSKKIRPIFQPVSSNTVAIPTETESPSVSEPEYMVSVMFEACSFRISGI